MEAFLGNIGGGEEIEMGPALEAGFEGEGLSRSVAVGATLEYSGIGTEALPPTTPTVGFLDKGASVG